MTLVEFAGIRLDARDAPRIAEFWAQVLAWRVESQAGGVQMVVPLDGTGYPLIVAPADNPKLGQNRIHFDLTSTSGAGMQDTISRALRLGGRHADVGQSPDERHTVLADPEDNEFCVIEPGSNFLADTGTVGAINCDGSQALGYFWSQALAWPLVWDQDEETAIQSPAGGSKITWSGPPLMPRRGRDRLRFVLSADDRRAATAHLTSLGATPATESGSAIATFVDPDGNEFDLGAGVVG